MEAKTKLNQVGVTSLFLNTLIPGLAITWAHIKESYTCGNKY